MKSAAHPLVFQWREKRRPLLILFWFFVLSFCVHALALYIFQVTYPSTVSIAPPPSQVSLLTPSTPEYRTLIRSIEAGNPALVMAPPDTDPPGLLQLRYKPSYSTMRATPKPVVEKDEPTRFPPTIHRPVTFADEGTAHEKPSGPQAAPRAGSLHFPGALAKRPIKKSAEFHPPQTNFTALKPSRFLLGVTDRGEVRFVFLEESCGDKTLDQWAERHLEQIEFAQDPQSITWGMAAFFWGGNPVPSDRLSP